MRFYFLVILSFPLLLVAQNKSNVERAKSIIVKGFCDETRMGFAKLQLEYLQSCLQLGEYYFKQFEYDSAMKYFLLPSEIDNHVYISKSQSRTLKLKCIVKGCEILVRNCMNTKDSTLALTLISNELFEISTPKLKEYSRLLFRIKVDTVVLGGSDLKGNPFWTVVFNPLLISDTNTLTKISNALISRYSKIDRLKLSFGNRNYPYNETGDKLISNALEFIKSHLLKVFPSSNIVIADNTNTSLAIPELCNYIDLPFISAEHN